VKLLKLADNSWCSCPLTLQISTRLKKVLAAVCAMSYYRTITDVYTVKAWICHHWNHLQQAEYPEIALLEAAHVVTPEKVKGWFVHSGYHV
jgi:hypothetical protein